MYSVSSNYRNYIKTNLSLSPKCKIVVDNVTYTGSVIKTAPKILHNCDRSFGEFPAKKVNFEIYNLNNNLDFENKEIVVYKGLYIDNQIEWVPQGIFKPNSSNITTNISTRTITIQDAQDRTQLFDVPYVSTLSWNNNQTHSGQEIVDDICTQIGIELANITFNWSSYQFKQPNFKEGITCREIIRRLAEIGNSIAFINREGKLEIKSRTATNEIIERKRYVNLSKENIVGPYNTLVLGKDGYNDDIIYPETIDTDRVEVKILDNPFVDLYRGEMIETIASYFIGSSYIPFELTDFVDSFYYDLNDEIEIVDKKGNKFKSVILNYESTSRIKSKIGANTVVKSLTDYNLAGSNKDAINAVKVDINHIKKAIEMVVSENKENSEKIAEIEITNKNITSSVKEIEETISGKNEYELTSDTVYASDKEYYSMNENGEYILLSEGEDYSVGDTINSNVYEKTTTTGLVQEVDNSLELLNKKVDEVKTEQTSQKFEISVISKNIDPETGEVRSVSTENGYTFNKDGMHIASNEDNFNALHNSKGAYYKDGESILTQFTIDNTIIKNLILYGLYYYGVDDELDVANFKKDDAMFVAQKIVDSNNEECFGHFYNGGN